MAESSPLKLSSDQKRSKIEFDVNKCVICQVHTSDTSLRNATEQGKGTFLKCLKKRMLFGDRFVYDMLQHLITEDENGNFLLHYEHNNLLWHKNCHASFTSIGNISRLERQQEENVTFTSPPSAASTSRAKRESFNFKELCLFCSKKSAKRDYTLINVATKQFGETLKKSVEAKNDDILRVRIGNFNKLVELDARYHKTCHTKYLKTQKMQQPNLTGAYDLAFSELLTEIKPILETGRALDMNQLLEKYQNYLKDFMSEEDSLKYKKQNLKSRFEKMSDTFTVYPGSHKKPDFVTSKSVCLEHTINTIAKLNQLLKDVQTEDNVSIDTEDFLSSPTTVLFYSALICRSMIRSILGIDCHTLNPEDITIEKCENIVNDEIYTFIYWLIVATPPDSPESVNKLRVKHENPALHRHILSLCQDLIYMASNGQCKMPKHVGMGLTIHQMCQSKNVVTILNKHGQSISYDDVQRIETSWAEDQMQVETFVPNNMAKGQITRGAGDNFNRATETLDGTHHDVVNMVLYQSSDPNRGHFGDVDVEEINRRRRILHEETRRADILKCPNLGGKQPGPKHLLGKVNMDWFTVCTQEHIKMRMIDKAFILLRNIPSKLFTVNFTKSPVQVIPGWSVFHAKVSSNRFIHETNIGYCPMISAPATSMDTIYTMMKKFQQMFLSLGQNWTYITYDEAIYSKAQMIKWRNPDEFENDELEMGGMHRALNFMGDIGTVMQESGFEDILIEANIYGPSIVTHAMKGKAYNRGIRIHKLMNEAMNRLKWNAFGNWVENSPMTKAQQQLLIEKIDVCCQHFADIQENPNRPNIKEVVESFISESKPLLDAMDNFVDNGRKCSDTFKFWDNYVSDLSQLLLDYIAAKRDDDRDLELETFAEMLPLDFTCGHTNYARWGSIYVTESKVLKDQKPIIYEALRSGHGSVFKSSKPFSAVWHDMAIEQSINKDCGKYQQIYTKEAALQKYYLTAHQKAAVSSMMKKMSGIYALKSKKHKEASKSRIAVDEQAVQSIVRTVTESMVNPFEVESGCSETNKQPLINIATSAVAPDEVSNNLCSARDIGVEEMKKFLNNRILTEEQHFFDPLPKPKFKSFASLNKPLKTKKKQNIQSVNIDRQIFSKLAVVGQSREVDLQSLLNYELTPVPLSLFNLDGSLRKTQKSIILQWLEKDACVDILPHSVEDTLVVIDFMMLLRMVLTETLECKTFGDLSDKLLSIILGLNCKYTAVVCDSYSNDSSIKSGERSRRGNIQMQEIRNPQRITPVPMQRKKLLSNPKNKSNITNFLMHDWIQQCEDRLIPGNEICLAGGFLDSQKSVMIKHRESFDIMELQSDHEEADSRMFLHVDYMAQRGVKRFIIWSIDSDVAAMCPYYCAQLDIDQLWFKTGTSQRKRFIAMHEVCSRIGNEFALILPAIHAFSGCDSVSAFSGKGKLKWIQTLQEHDQLLEGIKLLGNSPSVIDDLAVSVLEQLVSIVYSNKDHLSLNELRYELFAKKNFSSEKLPPTRDAFMHHLHRANYQTYIWTHSTTQFLNLPAPEENGWMINEQTQLVPRLMTQPPAPEAVLAFTQCKCKTDCSSKRCKCRKDDLTCSDVCHCNIDICSNRVIEEQDSETDEDDDDDDEEDI